MKRRRRNPPCPRCNPPRPKLVFYSSGRDLEAKIFKKGRRYTGHVIDRQTGAHVARLAGRNYGQLERIARNWTDA